MSKKTITFYQAHEWAKEFHGGQHSALYSFASTGELHHYQPEIYHAEVEQMIATPHKFMVKEQHMLTKLKRYLEVHVPIPDGKQLNVPELIECRRLLTSICQTIIGYQDYTEDVIEACKLLGIEPSMPNPGD